MSSKLQFGKDMFTLTYVDLEYETSISFFGIWIDDRTEMLVLPSFLLATRLNSQNANKTEFINGIFHIKLYMNIGISNWHNWIFDPSKRSFLFYFMSLHNYWLPTTWKSLLYTSFGEMKRCEKRASSLCKDMGDFLRRSI